MADIIKALFPDKKVPAGTENHYWVTSTRFMHEHFEVPIFFSIVYLAVVFLGALPSSCSGQFIFVIVKVSYNSILGPKFMEKRDKYNVKWIAVFWNGALAIFSILGTWGFFLFSVGFQCSSWFSFS